jgi:hypothetical protein
MHSRFTGEMNETCDRCGPAVRAIYRVNRDAELYLCGHCANQLRPALSAQGWSVRLAGERELAPQGRVAKPGTVTRARRITPAGSGGICPGASRNLN